MGTFVKFPFHNRPDIRGPPLQKKKIIQAGSSAFGFTKFPLGSMRHNEYYFHTFLYRSHMGMGADKSNSDTCTSVSFKLLQSYEKSHISMKTSSRSHELFLLKFFNYDTAN
jgi:hypothetical protein